MNLYESIFLFAKLATLTLKMKTYSSCPPIFKILFKLHIGNGLYKMRHIPSISLYEVKTSASEIRLYFLKLLNPIHKV